MIEEIISKSKIGAFGSIFFDVDVKISELGKPARTVSKTLTFGDYVKWLNQSLRKKETVVYYPIGPIPKGYVDARIGNDGSFYIAVCVPKAKRQVIYVGNPMYCAFPALVFLLHVNQKGTLSDANCFALKEDSITEDTLLWQYPYGHVSQDGRICMGSVPKSNLYGLISAEKVIEDFFLGEDQGHYYHKGFTHLNVPIGELFSMMEKADTFPTQYLTGGERTFREEWKLFTSS